ncbi:hypothetical protein FKP32DRAFT_971650 [Trametes sanguinea]|nr:hypothetical protein FKP32DRAFT_971650 [Trametes sanguinea]
MHILGYYPAVLPLDVRPWRMLVSVSGMGDRSRKVWYHCMQAAADLFTSHDGCESCWFRPTFLVLRPQQNTEKHRRQITRRRLQGIQVPTLSSSRRSVSSLVSGSTYNEERAVSMWVEERVSNQDAEEWSAGRGMHAYVHSKAMRRAPLAVAGFVEPSNDGSVTDMTSS